MSATTQSGMRIPTTVDSIRLIARGVILESIRRQEFYALIVVCLVYILIGGVTMVVGIENPSTGTFLLNLGMSFAWYIAMALTLITAARQIPKEVENRTIYPLLGKPLSRSSYILGKWLASAAMGIASFLVLFLLTWITIPKMEEYNNVMLVQAVILATMSLLMVAALSISFSLMMPQAVTVVILALWVLAAEPVVGFIRNRASGGSMESAVRWVTEYLPDFGRLNTITRYTDGISSLSATDFLVLILYATIFIGLALSLGIVKFERRPL